MDTQRTQLMKMGNRKRSKPVGRYETDSSNVAMKVHHAASLFRITPFIQLLGEMATETEVNDKSLLQWFLSGRRAR